MNSKNVIIAILSALLIISCSKAQWPNTVGQPLPIGNSNLWEGYPTTIPYLNGSTLVVYYIQYTGVVYQIIDKYGQCVFSAPKKAVPNIQGNYQGDAQAIPDSHGGAYLCWMSTPASPLDGMYAQRIDSLGNIMWGDSGKVIFPYPEPSYRISTDGAGGFLLAIGYQIIWAQRIDALGNKLWGDTGVAVCMAEGAQKWPGITHDGAGGAYISWCDYRPPYTYGANFMSHLDSNGVELWQPNGILFDQIDDDYPAMFPDGAGGFIMHKRGGELLPYGHFNNVHRIGWNGNLLWTRDHISWGEAPKIVPGESGFFYFIFRYVWDVYTQRIDTSGIVYYPTYGSGQVGAYMESSGLWAFNRLKAHFRSNYLYGIYDLRFDSSNYPVFLYVQKMDTLGNQCWGDRGVLLDTLMWSSSNYEELCCAGDGFGGVSGVFETERSNNHDLWAMHVQSNGELGGPPMPVNDIAFFITGGNLFLHWPRVPGASLYKIFVSDDPYKFPAEPAAVVSDTCYIDTSIAQTACRFYSIGWSK